jgi:flotillin
MFDHTLSAQGLPANGAAMLISVFVGIFVFAMPMVLRTRYTRWPSNRVLLIYGHGVAGNAAKCIHGGGQFVLPLIQDDGYLSLEPIRVAVVAEREDHRHNGRVRSERAFN